MEKLRTKTKLMITCVGVIAVFAVGGGVYANSQSKQKIEDAQKVVDKERGTLRDITKELHKLLDSKDNEFLAKDVTSEKIKELQDEFDQATKKVSSISIDLKKLNRETYASEETDTKELLEKIEKNYAAQNAVNKLYQFDDKSMALNGSKVTKDLAIADDLKKGPIQLVRIDFLQDKNQTTFDKVISELVMNAENQLKQINSAKQAVNKVFKEDKVISTDTKLYEIAKVETEKIKNTKTKKALNEQLEKVKAAIDKKVAETEKKQAEVKEEAAVDQSQQQQNVVATADTQAATDQGAAASADYTGAGGNVDTGGYVSQGNADTNYQQPQNQAPAQQETPVTTPQQPADNGGNGSSHVDMSDIQGSEDNPLSGGTTEWGGW